MSLPSLNLLRTFAVLGDTLNVKRAAERLHVTPTAVSHQLRELESALGLKLFRRLPRGLALTDTGQSYWAEVAPAIRQLEGATRARLAARPFRLSTFPSLAQSVLLPALPELLALLGERQLALDTRRDNLDLAGHGLDLALRLAPEDQDWGKLSSRRLSRFELTPLVGATLSEVQADALVPIRLAGERKAWPLWAEHYGWQPQGDGLLLDSYATVLGAAEQGLGLAMGFLPLCIEVLEQGRLRPLWPKRVAPCGALWAVWEQEHGDSQLLAVVDWLAARLLQLERRSAEFFSALEC